MTLLDAALTLQRNGLSVVPVATDGSKRPALPWQEYQATTATPMQLRTWFDNPAFDGLGVICGKVSGNLEMLEVEGRAVDLVVDLAGLMADHGYADLWARICGGYMVRSPSGGIHWLYRVDGPARGNTKLARRPGAAPNTVDVLIETRGEGGFVVTAPSAGRTHPTGNAWTVAAGSPDTIPTITVDERDALHGIATMLDQMPSVGDAYENPAPDSFRASLDGLRPGDDYNERAEWADILTPHGWQRGKKLAGGYGWTRPDKNPRDGISATTGQSADGVDRLYVFSSSTVFDTERPYSKFAAYALLEHGSDYAAAARELRRLGFGDQEQASPFGAGLTRPDPYSVASGPPRVSDLLAGDDEPLPAIEPSWRPVDLAPILSGDYVPETPALYPRSDEECLVYAGRVHSFHGESESGKSLAAQAECARLLKLGEDVLYVDFESDAAAVVDRLVELGATTEQVAAHFTYIRPDNDPRRFAHERAEYDALLARRFTLAVVDGVTDALVTFGAKSTDLDEVAAFMRFPRLLASKTGAAVIMVDHVTKDADSRGRFAVGSQAKMNALDGSAFVIEIVEPLGRGMRGAITMRVAKDRPGGVRPKSGMFRKSDRTQESARVVIDSTGDGIAVSVEAPAKTAENDEGVRRTFRPTHYMEQVSEFLAARGEAVSGKVLEDGVGGNSRTVRQAREILVTEGYISLETPNKRDRLYGHVKPYMQDSDPASDRYIPPFGDPTSATSANLGQTSAKSDPSTSAMPCPPLRGMAEVGRTQNESTSANLVPAEDKVDCNGCGNPTPRVIIEVGKGYCGACSWRRSQ